MEPSNPYASPYAVALSPENVRTEFFKKTYLHLAGAIGLFIILEMTLFAIPGITETVYGLLGTSSFSWLFVLGGFIGASYLAEKWARSDSSQGLQYAGLALLVTAYAIVFLPMLLLAVKIIGQPKLVFDAAIITLSMFGGLTFIAFTTKKDFSFLGGILKIGGFVALGLIVVSLFFNGLNLGTWFSAGMVLLSGVSILYQTSNIIHHYRADQYVAASLGLFASVAMMFYYVLRILISMTSSD